jgi:hypothetical protein
MAQSQQAHFSLWYFMITIAVLLAMQTLLPDYRAEMISYSQFKSLLRQGLIAEVVIAQESIRGTIKPGGMKQVLSAEGFQQLKDDGKSPHPFTTVRVEDRGLNR